MNNVTVAILQHNATYKFFETLIDAAGINRCWIDEIDYQADMTYILLSPADYPIPPQDRKARIIVWDLEPYYHEFQVSCFDEVWTFSKHYAGILGYKFVPMTAHCNFPGITQSDGSQWDVIHLSSYVDRRTKVYEQMKNEGLRIAPGAWAEERHNQLASARMIVNVFPYVDHFVISPIRPNWAAMYRIPLICEAYGDTMGLGGKLIEVEYQRIAQYCKSVSDRELDEYRYALHEYACHEYSIDRVIAANV